MPGQTMTFKALPGGDIELENDRSTIRVLADGTITISSLDPIVLAENSAAKLEIILDDPALVELVVKGLGSRIL